MAIGTAAAILGSAVIGGAVASRGAKKAAQAQTQAAEQASQVQREIFERQTELQEPFRQAGITAQNELLRMLGIGGDEGAADYGVIGRPFTAEQMEMDPGYGFRLAEGERALERMQAARGQLLGGGAIRAGVRYGQEMGSQEYMNAFNRAQALLGTRTSALGSLYGAGQTAAQQVAGQAGQMGVNVGNLMMGAGQARASGYLGQANALAQALGQGAMGYGLYRGGYFGPTNVTPGGGANLGGLGLVSAPSIPTRVPITPGPVPVINYGG
jgi:hypothetical protein